VTDRLPDDATPPPPPATPPPTATTPAAGAGDALLRDYHDARRREDQWRIPQLLLALATPILTLLSVLFSMGSVGTYAMISGALALITGVGAALLAIEVWRWHRTAFEIVNRFRTERPGDASLLMKDPL
jgi:hypothetical protein